MTLLNHKINNENLIYFFKLSFWERFKILYSGRLNLILTGWLPNDKSSS
jgi:hypothetical protein